MATVFGMYPYDPGSTESNKKWHGCKSYICWQSISDEASTENDNTIIVQNGQGQEILRLAPRSLVSIYLIVQIVLRYFLECLKRVAVTVKIYPLLHNKQTALSENAQVDILTQKKHEQIDIEKKYLVHRPNLSDLEIDLSTFREKRFDFAGYLKKINKDKTCLSTTFSTVIFEVKNGGLQYLVKDVANEIRNFSSICGTNVSTDHGSIIACCDLVWSAPSKYRSYWTELYLTNEIDQIMRINNQRIYDVLFASIFGLRRASRGGTTQVAGSTNKNINAYAGVYRHFYPELIDLANRQAAKEHGIVWNFETNLSKINVDWSVIGDFTKTTVVALNLIILKF